MPNNPLCAYVATLRLSKGCCSSVPFTTLLTVPASFSVNKISLGPKKAMLVGYLNPLKTASALRWASTIIGP